jgi:hypothetical protein
MSGCWSPPPPVETALRLARGQAPTCGHCGKQYEPVLADLWLKAGRQDICCTYCHARWRELVWQPGAAWGAHANMPIAS